MSEEKAYIDSKLDGTRVLNIFGPWDKEVEELIENASFEVVNLYRGSMEDFDTLAPFARKVRWLHCPSVDSSKGLEKLEFLEKLTQNISLPEPLFDYRRLPGLRHFACDLAALIPREYLNHPNMEALDLEGLKSPDLAFLSDARKLRALRLVGGSIKRADGLANYAELRELRLLQTRGLTDISALARAENLEMLELEGAPKVIDVSAICALSKLRWLFIKARNAKQEDLAWLANMPLLECAMILVETVTIDWDIFARLPRLYYVGFYTNKGYVAESDEALVARLSAHGKQVKAIRRFPKDTFPAFVIEFVPPPDIAKPIVEHTYRNHLRYKLDSLAPPSEQRKQDGGHPQPAATPASPNPSNDVPASPAPAPAPAKQSGWQVWEIPRLPSTAAEEIALSDTPEELMGYTAWTFDGSVSDDRAAFSAQVRDYQMDIEGKDSWQPDKVVLPLPRIQVAYEHWDDEGDQVEEVIELESANGKHFTALDLLFQIHNAVVENICDEDHHFFEGLTLEDGSRGGQTPRYSLNLGS